MKGFWHKFCLATVCAGLIAPQSGWCTSGYLLAPQGQEVRRIDLDTGQIVEKLSLPVGAVYHNAVRTPEGRLLVAGDNAVSIIEADGKLAATLNLPLPVVSASMRTSEAAADIPVLQVPEAPARKLVGIGYSPRTRLAYLGVRDEDVVSLYRLDPATQSVQILATLRDITNPGDLVVTADGLRIYVSGIELVPEPAGRLWAINPITGTVGAPLSVAFDPRRSQMALSGDGNLLYLMAADESVIVVNTRTNAPVRRLRVGATRQDPIRRVLAEPYGRELWVLTRKRLLRWDPLEGRATLSQALPAPPLDVVSSQKHFWSLHAAEGNVPAQVRRGMLAADDAQNSRATVVARFAKTAPGNRLLVPEAPQASATLALPRVAVVGFETGQPRFGRFPNVADIIAGDLLWTRRYEIVPPLQVESVLESLGLSREQLTASPEAIQQVATLLGADIILTGAPLKVEMPNRSLEALSALINPLAAFLVPQLFAPKVFCDAEAYDAQGKSIWKANVVNSDSAFFAGKTDVVLLANSLVITSHDIANKFSKGTYNEVKEKGWRTDLPPLLKNSALKDVKRVALLGPDSSIFNELTNTPESLGQLIAPSLSEALGWEVQGPDESLGQLAQLGLEPAQILTTDPKLLARALGVDAVMLGLVRSSTYISGGLIGLSQNAAADVVLQFELVDQQGRILWKDIQVRNISANDSEGGALKQAANAIVERLRNGLRQAQAPSEGASQS